MKQSRKLEVLVLILAILSLLLMVFTLTYSTSIVISGSMENTIMTDSKVLLKKNPKEINRYDIVSFKLDDHEIPYLKRVIGLPGDEIRIKDGHLFINKIKEEITTQGNTYIYYGNEPSSIEHVYHIPNASYFVLGDNREDSFDSRDFEEIYIKKSKITHKATHQLTKDKKLYLKRLR